MTSLKLMNDSIANRTFASITADRGSGASDIGTVSQVLLLFFVLTKPLYILPSGNFQVGDLLLMLAAVAAVFHRGMASRVEKKDLLLGIFIVCAGCVNLVYSELYDDPLFARSTLYYVFAWICVVLFRAAVTDFRFLNTLLWALRLGLLVQLAVFYLGYGRWYVQSTRYMGTFNDPNQFGVYVFFSFLILKLLSRILGRRYNYIEDVVVLYLVAQSSSTGMILGLAAYYGGCMLLLYRSSVYARNQYVSRFMGIGLVLAGLFYWIFSTDGVFSFLETLPVGRRITLKVYDLLSDDGSIMENFLADRGMTKMQEHPEYLLYGSGEGGYSRFRDIGSNLEIHSTLVGPWFYYGIIPFIVLLVWFALNLKNVWRSGIWVFLIALLLESATLANQRQPFFWLLVVLMAFAGQCNGGLHRNVREPHAGSQQEVFP